MKSENNKTGFLVISHGSPRDEANDAFAGMVERLASRLDKNTILPTFFSIKRPNIMDQVERLAADGVERIVMLPYFLGNGQHIRGDIPEQLDEVKKKFPGIEVEFLPTLQGEPGVEDILAERLMPFAENYKEIPSVGKEIAAMSNKIIDKQLESKQLDDGTKTIIRRIIHSTADFSFGQTVRVHNDAIARGVAALDAGKPVICDVNMVKAGMTSIDNEVLCEISSGDVIVTAKEKGTTRAAAAMEKLSGKLDGAIVVIGNAPTALFKVIEIAKESGIKPALVIGLPVGFVGARESKEALMQSDLCYISNIGFRGGSPVAAAALNAVASLRKASVEG